MNKIIKILLLFPALLGVLILRLLRPLIVIRLGGLDISRIGGMYFGDWYLSERAAGIHDKRNFDIFYFTTTGNTICNRQWLKMWQRVLRAVPFGQLFNMINRISRMLPGHQAHIVPMTRVKTVTTHEKKRLKCILANKRPNIAFTKEEELLGLQALKELGMPGKKPFICFHARDAAYLNVKYPKISWSYHDYRDSSIGNYVPVVEELVRRGYSAVRMGAVVKEKLGVTNSGIIDYAGNGQRTDFLDIYLGAKCEFFIASETGISIVPEIFRRPVVYTNWTPLKRVSPWILNGLVIFKKFYSRQEKRPLTFFEIMDLEFGTPDTEDIFAKRNIDLIENTPEEIKDVVMEMEDRIKGRWKSTDEDEQLQERFWELLGPDQLKSPHLRIGAGFLRQNQHLLSPNLTLVVENKEL